MVVVRQTDAPRVINRLKASSGTKKAVFEQMKELREGVWREEKEEKRRRGSG